MAKKRTKTESVLSRETRKQAEADALAAAKKLAEKVAQAAVDAAEALKKRVVAPVVKAVRPAKTKKPRYVREQKESKPQPAAAALPARSTKASGKLMTKNVHEKPRKERGSGVAGPNDPKR